MQLRNSVFATFGGYILALAALGLVVFGAHDSYPNMKTSSRSIVFQLPNIFFEIRYSPLLAFFFISCSRRHDEDIRPNLTDQWRFPIFARQ